jgi:hypothetical protein
MYESAPVTAEPSPLPFIIVTIIAGHAHALEALIATSMDILDHATLRTSYEDTINLACAL